GDFAKRPQESLDVGVVRLDPAGAEAERVRGPRRACNFRGRVRQLERPELVRDRHVRAHEAPVRELPNEGLEPIGLDRQELVARCVQGGRAAVLDGVAEYSYENGHGTRDIKAGMAGLKNLACKGGWAISRQPRSSRAIRRRPPPRRVPRRLVAGLVLLELGE